MKSSLAGLTYMPFPLIGKPDEFSVEAMVKGCAAGFQKFEARALKSILAEAAKRH